MNEKNFNLEFDSIISKQKYSRIFAILNKKPNRDRNITIKNHVVALKKVIVEEFTSLVGNSNCNNVNLEEVKFALQIFLREFKLLSDFMCMESDRSTFLKKLKDPNFKKDLKLVFTCVHSLLSSLISGNCLLRVKLLITTEELAYVYTKKTSADFYFCKIEKHPNLDTTTKANILVEENIKQTKKFLVIILYSQDLIFCC